MPAGTPSICGCAKDHRICSRCSHYRNKPSCEYRQNIVDGEAVAKRWQLFGREISVSRNRSCANGGGSARTHQPGLRGSDRNVKRPRQFNSREGRSDEAGAQELRNEAWAEVRGGRSATPDQECCYRGNQGGRSDRGCVFGAVQM